MDVRYITIADRPHRLKKILCDSFLYESAVKPAS